MAKPKDIDGYISQFPAAGKLPQAGEIPDRPMTIDTWVKSGRIDRLELPLNQFGTAKAGRVAVRLDLLQGVPPGLGRAGDGVTENP